MKRTSILSFATIVLFIVAGNNVFANDVQKGKELYLGSKYHCYSCHGQNGEGGGGPSFIGIGKRYDLNTLIKSAAHRCPPTGACSPKDMRLLAIYLRSL